jgi:hypothetical protein
MQGVWRELLGQPLEAALAVLPAGRRKAIGRWVRGREEARKLARTDHVLMSWGKSGRTWLRVMLSRFYQVAHGTPEGLMLEFDNLHRLDPRIPALFFTHSNYLRDYTGDWTTKKAFYDKKVLMLVRDPRDVAVSQYYQWKYRMRPVKKLLNDYPPHGAEVALFDFVMDAGAGLPKVIEFFEIWQRELPKVKASLVVRYEDMRADPGAVLGQVLGFLGTPGSPEQIADAVAYASYDNMKRLEQDQVYWLSGSRLAAGDPANPQSYKVRRAKVGGWRDDFPAEEVAAIDALLAARPVPPFGYGAAPEALPRAASDG